MMNMFKISSDCNMKICRPLKRRAILKIPSIVFKGTYALYVGFKMKLLGMSVFLRYDKNLLTFCRKICRKKQTSILCLFEDSPCSRNICNTMQL